MEVNINDHSLKELMKVTKGKAPCSICRIQNTCLWAGKCEQYQEWQYQRKKEKEYEIRNAR